MFLEFSMKFHYDNMCVNIPNIDRVYYSSLHYLSWNTNHYRKKKEVNILSSLLLAPIIVCVYSRNDYCMHFQISIFVCVGLWVCVHARACEREHLHTGVCEGVCGSVCVWYFSSYLYSKTFLNKCGMHIHLIVAALKCFNHYSCEKL